jgi:DNA-binding NtrC family response regulator
MVGESPAMWKLRERLAACALSDFHVLVIGGSGSGKELAAQAIHRLSRRAGRPLVADNISVMPASLASVLLFGNKRNFPNPGMDERVGLIGAADGSTLFLDEIGDMPSEVQPMFLRITERGGEYFRLGEASRPRRSSFRLVGATNRPEQMRYELKRRFQREIRVPGLEQRCEDIPLLIRQLLIVQARSDLIDAARFVSRGQPRVHPLLIDQLVRHKYTTHISEISFLLGQAMAESPHDVLMPLHAAHGGTPHAPHGDEAVARPAPRLVLRPRAPRRTGPRPLPSAQRAQQELDACNGDVTRTAAQLGISRDQLNRMIRREGLRVVRVRSGTGPKPAPEEGARAPERTRPERSVDGGEGESDDRRAP